MINPNPIEHCDPLGDFGITESLQLSLVLLFVMYLVFNIIAYVVMKKVAVKQE